MQGQAYSHISHLYCFYWMLKHTVHIGMQPEKGKTTLNQLQVQFQDKIEGKKSVQVGQQELVCLLGVAVT
mgnify:FL=1